MTSLVIVMTDFNNLVNDLRYGLKVAKNNVVSYFLAFLALVIIGGLMIAAVVIPVALATWGLWIGPMMHWGEYGAHWDEAMPMWFWENLPQFTVLGITVTLLLATLCFTLVGALFGMTREAVTEGTTRAESSLGWLRHRFVPLLGAGFALALVIVLPQLIVWAGVFLYYGSISPSMSAVLTVFSYLWTFLTLGLMSMTMPGVVAGLSVREAVETSLSTARRHTERVFGLWAAVILIYIVTFLPFRLVATSWWGTAPMWSSGAHMMAFVPVAAGVALWAIAVWLFWILLGFPAILIVLTKIYVEDVEGGTVVEPPAGEIPVV